MVERCESTYTSCNLYIKSQITAKNVHMGIALPPPHLHSQTRDTSCVKLLTQGEAENIKWSNTSCREAIEWNSRWFGENSIHIKKLKIVF